MTPFMKRILVANVAVWLVEVISVNFIGTAALLEHLALTPVRVVGGLEIWQVATYMWLHSPTDFSHILFNCLFLWMFGGTLEVAWGSRDFLRFYLTCGVGAGVVVLAAGLFVDPMMPVLGASGAIYGLVVAWAIAYPNRLIYFFGIFPMKGKHFVLIPIFFAVADFLTRAQGVSHAAHLGGMIIGALLVTGLWRPDKLKRQIRYWLMRRRIRMVERDDRDGPPGSGYFH